MQVIAVGLAVVAIAACQPKKSMEESPVMQQDEIKKAVCVLHPTQGNTVTGVVHFMKSDSGITVHAMLEGLSEGEHGFHVHLYGDCSAPDGALAEGHFNPDNMKHGAPSDIQRHVGDLGNIVADSEGKAHLMLVDKHISLNGKNSIIGRAIIVHMGKDDLTSQPTGNAGARVACGVIGIAK